MEWDDELLRRSMALDESWNDLRVFRPLFESDPPRALYLGPLNLHWSPAGRAHDLERYRRVGETATELVGTWSRLILDRNWRPTLSRGPSVALLADAQFQDSGRSRPSVRSHNWRERFLLRIAARTGGLPREPAWSRGSGHLRTICLVAPCWSFPPGVRRRSKPALAAAGKGAWLPSCAAARRASVQMADRS